MNIKINYDSLKELLTIFNKQIFSSNTSGINKANTSFTFKLPDIKTGQCLHLGLKFPEVLDGSSNWSRIFSILTIQWLIQKWKLYSNRKKKILKQFTTTYFETLEIALRNNSINI
jgi:hypothetical protein